MLAKNNLLEEIAKRLSGSSFPFVDASEHMRQHPPPSQDEGVLRGRLAELGIHVLLERLSRENPQIIPNPIRTPSTTEHYHFSRDAAGNLNVGHRSCPGRSYERISDYYDILLVDSLPAVVEVKVRATSQGKNRRALRRNGLSPSSGKISLALESEPIAQKIAPLQEYFRCRECAYLMILLPERLRRETPSQQEFTRLGGLLVPFPLPGEDFRDLAGIYLKPYIQGRHLERYGHGGRS